MLRRRVVQNEVKHDAYSASVGGRGEITEVVEGSEARIDAQVLCDVVAVVFAVTRVERQKPQARDPEVRQVVELLDQARQVTEPVAVRVAEPRNIDAVEDRFPRPGAPFA